MNNPYAPPQAESARTQAETPNLVLAVGEAIPAVCLKCGAREHLGSRQEALTYVSKRDRFTRILLGSLFGALGGLAMEAPRVVKLAIHLCGDCEARWDHARASRRRLALIWVVVILAILGLGGATSSVALLGVGLAFLFAAVPVFWWFDRAHVRPNVVWIADMAKDEFQLGGVAARATRAVEKRRKRSSRVA